MIAVHRKKRKLWITEFCFSMGGSMTKSAGWELSDSRGLQEGKNTDWIWWNMMSKHYNLIFLKKCLSLCLLRHCDCLHIRPTTFGMCLCCVGWSPIIDIGKYHCNQLQKHSLATVLESHLLSCDLGSLTVSHFLIDFQEGTRNIICSKRRWIDHNYFLKLWLTGPKEI